MLVLTRKPGTSIIIGNRLINVKILEINGQQVRIGIEAPENISVHRDEIYQKIEKGILQKTKDSTKKPLQAGNKQAKTRAK